MCFCEITLSLKVLYVLFVAKVTERWIIRTYLIFMNSCYEGGQTMQGTRIGS